MPRKRLKSHECPNCGHKFATEKEHPNYCPNCGQENHNPRHPLLHYGYELLESITHFDSKFLYSLKVLLFSPGTLSRDYVNNIRGRYTPPVRMFIFISLFSLIVMGAFEKMLWKNGAINSFSSSDQLSKLTVGELFDRSADSITDQIIPPPFSWFMNNPVVSNKDLRVLKRTPVDSIGNWLSNYGYSNNMLTRFFARNKQIRISRDMLWTEAMHMVSMIFKWLFLLLVPVMALVYFVVFYSRKKFLYDSLIFSVHITSMLMIMISLSCLLVLLFDLINIKVIVYVFPCFLIGLVVYLLIAARRVYNFGWLSTLLRSPVAWLLVYALFQLLHYYISNHSGR